MSTGELIVFTSLVGLYIMATMAITGFCAYCEHKSEEEDDKRD